MSTVGGVETIDEIPRTWLDGRMGTSAQRASRSALEERILDAANRIAKLDASKQLTARSLAKAAGVSVSSLYRCFASMEEVRREAASRERYEAGWRATAPLRARAESLGLSECRVAVRAFIESEIEVARRFPSSAAGDRGSARAERGMTREARREIRRFVELAGRNTRNPEHAAHLIVHGLGSAIRSFLRHDPERLSDPAFQDEIADMAWAYLTTPRESP